jgi:hypothetical protein
VLGARIVLLDDEGLTVGAIASLGIVKNTVIEWITRLKRDPESIVIERIKDLPRSGCLEKFTAEKICKIIATCCENPMEYGRLIMHWTQRELVDVLTKQKVVKSFSTNEINTILRGNDLQPHRNRYWLHVKPDEFRDEGIANICSAMQMPRPLQMNSLSVTMR